MNFINKFALTFWIGLFLVSCSTMVEKEVKPTDTNLNYKNEQSIGSESSLAIPPDLVKPNTTDLFNNDRQTVNRASYLLSTDNSTEILVKDNDKVKLNKLGAYRWLEIESPSKEVYDAAKKFLTQLGFDLAVDDPAIGLLETNWKENKPKIPEQSLGIVRSAISKALNQIYSQGKIDRFRMRIENKNNTSSEVFITHQSMVEEDVAGTNTWKFADSDKELETEITYRFLVYLGLKNDDAKTIAASNQDIETDSLVQKYYESTNGLSYKMAETFDRAWLMVGWAIDRSDYIIYDRNREAGIFYIKLGENLVESRKGFLDKLTFWKKETDISSLKVQVKIRTIGNEVQISILGENNEKIPNSQAKIFLDDLIKNL